MAQARERSAPGQVLLDEASPPSRRQRFGRWPLVRPRERNRCSQLQFFPFFNEANENPRRAIWSPRIPSKPDHPQVSLRKTARIIVFLPRRVKGEPIFFEIGVDGGAGDLVDYPRLREKGNAVQRPVLVVAQLR